MLRSERLNYLLSCVFIVLYFLFMFFPELSRSMLFFSLLLFVSLLIFLFSRYELKGYALFFWFNIFFVLTGGLYIFFSLIFKGWSDEYVFSAEFVFRHSYFVVVLPLLIFSSISISELFSVRINNLLGSYSSILLCSILFLDTVLAYYLGDLDFKDNNDYTYYLDKGLIWLVISYVFLYSLYNLPKGRRGIDYFIVLFFVFVQNKIGYGTMFTAETGKVIFLVMTALYFYEFLNVKRKFVSLGVCTLFVLVLAFVFCAPFFSDYFIEDLNTYWRLESWRSNITSVLSNFGFGFGFGTSYFSLNYDVIDAAYKAYSLNDKYQDVLSHVFIRGQHSSLINIFFRMGFVGLLIFLIFISYLIYCLHVNRLNGKVFFLMPLLFFAFINISTHVGLENPVFLTSFCVTVGFVLNAVGVRVNKYFIRL